MRCDGRTEGITPRFHEADGVGEWRALGEGGCADVLTGSFAAGAQFVQAIAELAGLDATTRRSTCGTRG